MLTCARFVCYRSVNAARPTPPTTRCRIRSSRPCLPHSTPPRRRRMFFPARPWSPAPLSSSPPQKRLHPSPLMLRMLLPPAPARLRKLARLLDRSPPMERRRSPCRLRWLLSWSSLALSPSSPERKDFYSAFFHALSLYFYWNAFSPGDCGHFWTDLGGGWDLVTLIALAYSLSLSHSFLHPLRTCI